MLQAKQGVFMQHSNQLDLSHDVVLYRDDGTTMTTSSAAIDLKNGAAAGGEPVHVEGPFGILDAQGFTLLDKGSTIQFPGPAHLVLNGASSTAPPGPSPEVSPATSPVAAPPVATPAANPAPAPSAAPPVRSPAASTVVSTVAARPGVHR
jgi:lipopolysaccharide export system protein LptC